MIINQVNIPKYKSMLYSHNGFKREFYDLITLIAPEEDIKPFKTMIQCPPWFDKSIYEIVAKIAEEAVPGYIMPTYNSCNMHNEGFNKAIYDIVNYINGGPEPPSPPEVSYLELSTDKTQVDVGGIANISVIAYDEYDKAVKGAVIKLDGVPKGSSSNVVTNQYGVGKYRYVGKGVGELNIHAEYETIKSNSIIILDTNESSKNLHHITLETNKTICGVGETLTFTAKAYDEENHRLPNIPLFFDGIMESGVTDEEGECIVEYETDTVEDINVIAIFDNSTMRVESNSFNIEICYYYNDLTENHNGWKTDGDVTITHSTEGMTLTGEGIVYLDKKVSLNDLDYYGYDAMFEWNGRFKAQDCLEFIIMPSTDIHKEVINMHVATSKFSQDSVFKGITDCTYSNYEECEIPFIQPHENDKFIINFRSTACFLTYNNFKGLAHINQRCLVEQTLVGFKVLINSQMVVKNFKLKASSK